MASGAQGVAWRRKDGQAASAWTTERSSWTHQDRDLIHLMEQDRINTLLDVARRQGSPSADLTHATTAEVLVKQVMWPTG